jgi:hypothetical protein
MIQEHSYARDFLSAGLPLVFLRDEVTRVILPQAIFIAS